MHRHTCPAGVAMHKLPQATFAFAVPFTPSSSDAINQWSWKGWEHHTAPGMNGVIMIAERPPPLAGVIHTMSKQPQHQRDHQKSASQGQVLIE
jgi:hypothetical protein